MLQPSRAVTTADVPVTVLLSKPGLTRATGLAAVVVVVVEDVDVVDVDVVEGVEVVAGGEVVVVVDVVVLVVVVGGGLVPGTSMRTTLASDGTPAASSTKI